MPDPFSTAAGAVGVVSLSLQLLGGCIKGFVLLSTAHDLGKDASTIVCMLNLEEIQLMEWARRAGLLSGNGSLDLRLNAKAVEETLNSLQRLLLDTDKLKDRYGLTILPNTTGQQITAQLQATSIPDTEKVFTSISNETRQQILTRAQVVQDKKFFNRLWWAAVDKDKIENLVKDINFFIRALWYLLDPLRHDDLLRSTQNIAAGILSLNNKFDQLKSFQDALNSLQKVVEPLNSSGIKDLATLAGIKALRVGLGHDKTGDSPATDVRVPKRQDLLEALEHLSKSKYKSFKSLKKNKSMGMAEYGPQKVFVELKSITPSLRSKILPRAENLAALLNLPKDQTFQSLSCRGIIELDDKIAFIFNPAAGASVTEPISLLDLFSAKDGIKPPSLTDRVRLALRFAQVVQNFHRTGWLNKSLRSENVLFFRDRDSLIGFGITDFVLAGFAYSRFGSPTEISEQPSADPTHDIYRHPSAMGEPSESFSELMDIYSLGTVLLEIAEWRALRYLVDSVVDVGADTVPLAQLAKVRPFLLGGNGKGGTTRLSTRMGDIYTSACMMCLSGKGDASSADTTSIPQKSLLDQVVRRLETCNV